MNTNRLKEPVVLAGVAVVLMLLGTWMFPRRQTDTTLAEAKILLENNNARLKQLEDQLAKLRFDEPSQSYKTLGQMTDESKEFSEAIRLGKEQLEAGNFLNAYDLLLVSSRLRPSDSQLFDLLLTFIQKTRNSETSEAALLADDLISRGESLIHFQPPKDVTSARQRFTQVSLLNSPSEEPVESPFSEVLDLLSVAENAAIPVSIRTRAAEQARSTLDEMQVSRAITDKSNSTKDDSSQILAIQQKIDSAEQACISDLFQKTKERATGWLASTQELLKETDSANTENTPGLVKRSSTLISNGFDIAQELTPYAKSGVSGAADLAAQANEKLTLLQRTKIWLYNQQVLYLIRDIEPRKDLSSKEKIQYLAEVDEEQLSPYILRRHNVLWEKIFDEELKNEDEKVWAVRLRILGVKQ